MTPSHGIISNVGGEFPGVRDRRDPFFSSFNVFYSAVLMTEFKLEPCTILLAFVFLLPLANDQTYCSNTIKFAA